MGIFVATVGRRPLPGMTDGRTQQHIVDPDDSSSYATHLSRHDVATCTLGVGQPSGISREEFVRVDQTYVLAFARACREAGVRHFLLLGSAGAHAHSRSFYLRTKGEIEEGLRDLGFERLILFRPSMILTPTNRYGVIQGLTLSVWPKLQPLLVGSLRQYRGIRVQDLGRAMALRAGAPGPARTSCSGMT